MAGFRGKDIVLVADEDGFEIPTLVNEVVLDSTDDYAMSKVIEERQKRKQKDAEADSHTSIKQALAVQDVEEEEETELSDKEITFVPKARERKGAESLELALAIVPEDIHKLGETGYSVYLVNDCNYYISCVILAYKGRSCQLKHQGEIAPNTKVWIEDITLPQTEEWNRITVQTLAFKRDKNFFPQPACSVNLRVDAPKLYKLHAFGPSDFFDTPALLFPVLHDGHPARSMFVDAEELQEAMLTPEEQLEPRVLRVAGAERRAERKADKNAVIEVDLHAEELLDTLAGLDNKDILTYQLKVFDDTMKAHIKEHGRRIVFIHGKGEGVLRQALLKQLGRDYKQCAVQDASFREYGYGATMVTIR